MRPVWISPCSVCGVTLEHDHDPRTVLCSGCELDRIAAQAPNVCSVSLKPPPTTEWHGRQPYKPIRHQLELIVMAMVGIAFSLGFIVGFLVRGAG